MHIEEALYAVPEDQRCQGHAKEKPAGGWRGFLGR